MKSKRYCTNGGLKSRPPDYESNALPIALQINTQDTELALTKKIPPPFWYTNAKKKIVGIHGFIELVKLIIEISEDTFIVLQPYIR